MPTELRSHVQMVWRNIWIQFLILGANMSAPPPTVFANICPPFFYVLPALVLPRSRTFRVTFHNTTSLPHIPSSSSPLLTTVKAI